MAALALPPPPDTVFDVGGIQHFKFGAAAVWAQHRSLAYRVKTGFPIPCDSNFVHLAVNTPTGGGTSLEHPTCGTAWDYNVT